MSKGALRFSGHGDRGVKGRGKRRDRDTNNRENKKNHVGGCEPNKNGKKIVNKELKLFIFNLKTCTKSNS